MSHFAIAPACDWILAAAVRPERRNRLRRGGSYERTVADVLATSTHVSFRRQRGPTDGSARCTVTIQVAPTLLDRFFSSACGYRAQYFVCPHTAHLADSHVVQAALPPILRFLASRPTRSVDRAFLDASLSHPWVKVWPYQGLWLRRAKLTDRLLLVPRWQQGLSSGSEHRCKLARWGSLAPECESRLQIKGGYVRNGKHLLVGKPQAKRAREIHELGFT